MTMNLNSRELAVLRRLLRTQTAPPGYQVVDTRDPRYDVLVHQPFTVVGADGQRYGTFFTLEAACEHAWMLSDVEARD